MYLLSCMSYETRIENDRGEKAVVSNQKPARVGPALRAERPGRGSVTGA